MSAIDLGISIHYMFKGLNTNGHFSDKYANGCCSNWLLMVTVTSWILTVALIKGKLRRLLCTYSRTSQSGAQVEVGNIIPVRE